MATRPTSDRLRETLFNVLAPRFENAPGGLAFLDLYAGSGAVGLEALSRGARFVTFVERAPAALKALRGNLEALKVEPEEFHVFAGNVAAYLRSMEGAGTKSPKNVIQSEKNAAVFSVLYLDPPYEDVEEYEATLRQLGGSGFSLLDAGAVVVAEQRRKEKLGDRYGSLARTRLLQQGDAALSFYGRSSPEL
jgi:16S rRNA (guanine(966)-N(2))-methyltransferase RsmD